MLKTYLYNEIPSLSIKIKPGDIIFLYGDLAAGKTTLTKHMVQNILGVSQEVKSPTYTYYNKYGENIYHFDLYRLQNYDEFFAIGGEEILQNTDNICIVEWPEIIEKYFSPTKKIYLSKTQNDSERQIEIL